MLIEIVCYMGKGSSGDEPFLFSHLFIFSFVHLSVFDLPVFAFDEKHTR